MAVGVEFVCSDKDDSEEHRYKVVLMTVGGEKLNGNQTSTETYNNNNNDTQMVNTTDRKLLLTLYSVFRL